jgi:hypothetical protein
MLWFRVDMHQRQRYFFICGSKKGIKRMPREGREIRSSGQFAAQVYVAFPDR